MLNWYGNDVEYARQKLSNSVVKLDGEPIWVVAIDAVDCVLYSKVSSPTIENYTSLEKLDFSPFKLGNYNGLQTFYVSRIPVRGWTQGLKQTNLQFSTKLDLSSTAFYNLLIGKYPSFEECVECLINEERTKIAFNRVFSIYKEKDELILFYKNSPVGTIFNYNKLNVNFFNHYSFLRELYYEGI